VRELENAVERAMVTCRTRMLVEDDFAFLRGSNGNHLVRIPSSMTLQDLEKHAIVAAMERSGGNVKEAAAALGIDRSTLYDKLKRYEVAR
jgi:DNA-binding NtrC family response regulator